MNRYDTYNYFRVGPRRFGEGLKQKEIEMSIDKNVASLDTYKILNEVRKEEDLKPIRGGDVVNNPAYFSHVSKEKVIRSQGHLSDDITILGIINNWRKRKGLPPLKSADNIDYSIPQWYNQESPFIKDDNEDELDLLRRQLLDTSSPNFRDGLDLGRDSFDDKPEEEVSMYSPGKLEDYYKKYKDFTENHFTDWIDFCSLNHEYGEDYTRHEMMEIFYKVYFINREIDRRNLKSIKIKLEDLFKQDYMTIHCIRSNYHKLMLYNMKEGLECSSGMNDIDKEYRGHIESKYQVWLSFWEMNQKEGYPYSKQELAEILFKINFINSEIDRRGLKSIKLRKRDVFDRDYVTLDYIRSNYDKFLTEKSGDAKKPEKRSLAENILLVEKLFGEKAKESKAEESSRPTEKALEGLIKVAEELQKSVVMLKDLIDNQKALQCKTFEERKGTELRVISDGTSRGTMVVDENGNMVTNVKSVKYEVMAGDMATCIIELEGCPVNFDLKKDNVVFVVNKKEKE